MDLPRTSGWITPPRVVVLVVWAVCARPVLLQAQDWGQKMFEVAAVDFGRVATGSECSRQIKIKNIYKETIYLTEVRTSCACARAVANVTKLESGQEGILTVSMDTVRYRGKRDSNALITLHEPTKGLYTQVRIPLSVYIRSDVVFTPGQVQFGSVEQGSSVERKVHVAYAGRQDWQIVQVVSPKPYVQTRLVETLRSGGNVEYDLFVTLSAQAPIGSIREQLLLVTDDAGTSQVPLSVEGRVEAEFTLSPEVWSLGEVTAGSVKTQNLVIRGRKPFKIEKIECTHATDAFRVVLPTEARLVHVLPLKFVAPPEPGDIDELFTVNIVGRSEPLTFRATGKVVATATTH
ncbi:MAG: hypothetical protein KatS3mg114_0692 [Planctomycetaceae bacterium]|nr:MAG: hypothetical protein KatS3mg114_0692 [Planctomycetaceae bacterium]